LWYFLLADTLLLAWFIGTLGIGRSTIAGDVDGNEWA